MPEQTSRGRLRVYLGAAPGVGKTFAALDEARRRRDRGTDVVVAVAETHGRRRTAEQLEGLEVVPRRAVSYGGTMFDELDLAAVIARAPDVAVVDELAHTNVPGVEHEKRWQDVHALLDAGIDVITTVNVQHLESLNDVVEQVTGVRQRETVPDTVVRDADAIELVDMSPQALRRRLAHGNVYAADKVDAALSQFFREGNLTALRELALLWLADRVDEGMDRYRSQHEIDSTWAARERIVVAVTGGPESEVLLRRAARIASRTGGGQWKALYVTRGDGLVQVDPARLHGLHAMTERLGGTFHSVVGDDTSSAILDFASAENATQVLIGASRRGRVSTLLRPGIGEVVIAESGDIDVHIVTHDEARRRGSGVRADHLGRRRQAAGFGLGAVGPFLLSFLLDLTQDLHGLPTEAMLFMVLVVATALVGGLLPAIVASLVSGFALNFFFTPPLGNLTIANPENALALVLFVVVGIAVASVVDLAARRTAQAERATAEAEALTVLSHGLLHAGDEVQAVLASACELFGMRGAAVVTDGVVAASAGDGDFLVPQPDASVAIDDRTTLVLVGRPLPADGSRLLKAYAAHVKVLGERRRARRDSEEKRALAETDRARTALLAAVSHDLRTPLAAVKAAVASLRNTSIDWSAEDEEALLATVEEGADRLEDLVANLLDMSRLQVGAVTARRELVDVDEVVRAATVGLPGVERLAIDCSRAPTVVADGGLLERVVANLVANALAYAPTGPVRVDTCPSDERVLLRVIDAGPGVPEEQRPRLFEPFQRLGDVPQGEGVGLGLAVARGLVEAMGGTLAADDTPGGGTTFVVDLPAREGS